MILHILYHKVLFFATPILIKLKKPQLKGGMKMHEAYDCGLIIRELREKANMTQQELGKKINRDKGIISRYENNYQAVPFETMRTLASIFNVSMDYLAGMEKRSAINTSALTETQAEIMQRLAEAFREINRTKEQSLSSGQFEIIGRIVTEFLKATSKNSVYKGQE